MSENKKRGLVRNYLPLPAMLGYLVAAVWGHLAFGGDLPWGAMWIGTAVAGLLFTVAAIFLGHFDKRWDGWPTLAMMFVVSIVGALSGILLGS